MQSNQNPDLTSPDHLLDQEAKEDFTEFKNLRPSK